MDKTGRTEVLQRWLLSDPSSVTYRYWQQVTREILEETKVVTTRRGWTRHEAAVFLLSDQLQHDIAGDLGLQECDVGMQENPSHTERPDVDWWTLAEVFIEEHTVKTPKTTTGPRQRLNRVASWKRSRRRYRAMTKGAAPQ